ncbi:hypothetical protein ACLOJK_035376 [Asimina triloba]
MDGSDCDLDACNPRCNHVDGKAFMWSAVASGRRGLAVVGLRLLVDQTSCGRLLDDPTDGTCRLSQS